MAATECQCPEIQYKVNAQDTLAIEKPLEQDVQEKRKLPALHEQFQSFLAYAGAKNLSASCTEDTRNLKVCVSDFRPDSVTQL